MSVGGGESAIALVGMQVLVGMRVRSYLWGKSAIASTCKIK